MYCRTSTIIIYLSGEIEIRDSEIDFLKRFPLLIKFYSVCCECDLSLIKFTRLQTSLGQNV